MVFATGRETSIRNPFARLPYNSGITLHEFKAKWENDPAETTGDKLLTRLLVLDRERDFNARETMQSASRPFDQFRINHSEGLTPTEQLLKRLGERSFLRFWSHANPHSPPSQEFCDLLVVCGDYVIIFSDKSNNFQFHKNVQIAWQRWYREAVAESVRQLNGAVRHLFELQTPIYKDRACSVPLGIPLPPPDRARVYRVAVVSLSREIDEVTPPQPFLALDGAIIGEQHIADDATPFRLGDVSPDSEFVHVIDLAGLWAVLSDLDTITDFARYLDARRAFLRGQVGNSAASEWCMLTRYLLSFTDDGEPLPLDSASPGYTRLSNAEWQAASTKAAFRERKEANRDSYLWDWLVERQALMVEQQSFDFSTYNSAHEAERAVRHLALETRLNRRLLGRGWKEACIIESPDQIANIRTVPHSDNDATTYVFFTLKQPDGTTDDQYRRRRRDLVQNMMLASLIDVPTSEVIIGIASELGQVPNSYDLLHFNVAEDANHDSLRADAKACWNFKKQIFGDPRRTVIDERDVPPIG